MKKMNEKKLRNSFRNVRTDMDALRYEASNNIRYLKVKTKEQGIRIKELERRLGAIEILHLRERIVE